MLTELALVIVGGSKAGNTATNDDKVIGLLNAVGPLVGNAIAGIGMGCFLRPWMRPA